MGRRREGRACNNAEEVKHAVESVEHKKNSAPTYLHSHLSHWPFASVCWLSTCIDWTGEEGEKESERGKTKIAPPSGPLCIVIRSYRILSLACLFLLAVVPSTGRGICVYVVCVR